MALDPLDWVAAITMCLPSSSVTMPHQDLPDQYSVVQNLGTLQGTNTLALDPNTGKIYLQPPSMRPRQPWVQRDKNAWNLMVAVYGPR
jgi:hypothetical protein